VQAGVLAVAKARAEGMAAAAITVTRRASEEGRLFGSIGTSDIVDAMAEVGMELVKAEVLMPQGALKDVGEHEVLVSLHPEVEFKIRVTIVAEA